MLRKIMLGTAVVGAVVAVAAFDSPVLTPYVQALQGADALNAKYMVSVVGGASANYSINLQKPNKLRLETPSRIVVANGTEITYFDRAGNSYYKVPQSKEALLEVFGDDDVSLWRSFFDAKALDYVKSAKNEGNVKSGGKTLQRISAVGDDKGEFTFTLFLDPTSKMLDKAAINMTAGGSTKTKVITTESLTTSAGKTDLFAFTPPKDSKELSAEEMMAGKWFTNFEEAMAVAKKTGKLMMVDFYATWCVPCKMMDEEAFHAPGFQERAKNFILVKVDAEIRTDLAQRYGITAYPTVKFINGSGQLVHEFVGYGGPAQVFGEMDKASGKN